MKPFEGNWRLWLSGIMTGALLPLWFLAFVLGEFWARAHPIAVDEFTLRHKGLTSIGYLSQFESTSYGLMLVLAPMLFLIGVQLTPKKNIRTRFFSYTYDVDDPRGLLLRSRLLGAVLVPVAALTVGPLVVRALNALGVTVNFG